SFHAYLPADGASVAACHMPLSIFTSTERSGVPSFNTKPTTLCWLPSFVTRATMDFRRMWVTAVSFHTVSPSIFSSRIVRYHRGWYLPMNGPRWTWMRDSHLTLATPYQPGTSRRSGAPWCFVSGSPLSAYTIIGSPDSAISRARLRPNV